jgi:hypothetical protein
MVETDGDRHVRAAENQALFREVNERVRDLNDSFSELSAIGDWVCECANTACSERIQLSVVEYEAARAVSDQFLVLPAKEHVFLDVEAVIEQNDRYWVVKKLGEASPQVRLKLLRDFERRLAAERNSNVKALAVVRKLISDGESAASRE